jgi:polyisoprenoid-binding protein YceI
MRENYLETDKYPTTFFKGQFTSMIPEGTGEFQLVADGRMYIHGIEKEKSVSARMIALEEGYKIICNFSILLPDYKIEVPQLMFMKINEEIKLEIEFYLLRVGEQEN